MIENPGFPAKYGHWLKLFVWPVPFTSRPALTGRKYFGSESLKGTKSNDCQKTARKPTTWKHHPQLVQDHHQGIVTGTTCRGWAPLILPTGSSLFVVGPVLLVVCWVLSRKTPWSSRGFKNCCVGVGAGYRLPSVTRWAMKKNLVVVGYIGDFTTQLYLD